MQISRGVNVTWCWFFEVYEREENVFIAGSWVSFLHITATGTYSYIEGGVSMQPM